MKKIAALLVFFALSANAGLPPTQTKGQTDSSNSTTFNFAWPDSTVYHSGVTASLTRNGRPMKNYIRYADLENGATTGWSLGTVGTLTNGLPTGSPTFGSGASGNLSISASSSSPLAGTYSLAYASSAATTSGNMLASDAIPIDTEDQAKVLSVRYYFSATSNPSNANWSGTSSNSFAWAAWDATNSVWLTSSANFCMTQSSGVGICTGSLQTGASTASLRFVIYNSNATTGAVTVAFDDFYVGPQNALVGPTVVDYGNSPWTPTGTWSANTTYTGSQSRIGDKFYGKVHVSLSGAPTGNFVINLPAGISIDTSKGSYTAGQTPVGYWQGTHGAAGYAGTLTYSTTTAVVGITLNTNSGSNPVPVNVTSTMNATTPVSWGSGDAIDVYIDALPIAGWSSNTSTSSDYDGRPVVVNYTGAPPTGTLNSSLNPVTYGTKVTDNFAAMSGSTYTIPVTGFYGGSFSLEVSASTAAAGNDTQLAVFVNGVKTFRNDHIAFASTDTDCIVSVNFQGYLFKAGDTVQVQAATALGTPTFVSNAVTQFFSLSKAAGSPIITSGESISAKYTGATTSTASGGTTTLINGTKAWDNTNSYNASTGVFTAPTSGKYLISGSVSFNNTGGNMTVNTNYALRVQKNGSNIGSIQQQTIYTATTITTNMAVSDMQSLNAGDTLSVALTNSTGQSLVADGSAFNSISIARVGN